MRSGVCVAGQYPGKRFFPLVGEITVDGIPVTLSCRVLKLWPDITGGRVNLLVPRSNCEDNALLHPRIPIGTMRRSGIARSSLKPVTRGSRWLIGLHRGYVAMQASCLRLSRLAKRKGKKPGPRVCDDLVQWNFTAASPNDFWLLDITDVSPRLIVGYSISDRRKARTAVDVLTNAVARVRDASGCRGDNAALESFFAPPQRNVLNRDSGATDEELRSAIVWWIERTYHRTQR